jgi:hypothetical protein
VCTSGVGRWPAGCAGATAGGLHRGARAHEGPDGRER